MAATWGWALILLGALCVLVELALGGFAGFDLALIGTCFALGGVIALWSGTFTTGVIAAIVLSALYIAVGRRWMRARLHRPGVRSNTDALLGARARVMTPLHEHAPGQVRVRDEVWRARPTGDDTIEAGAEVTIEAVDGVTLLVRR